MTKLIRHYLLLILLISLAGCLPEAERDNPLDPNSNNYYPNSISGTIFTYYPPYQPLPDVLVTLSPGGYYTYSDQNGFYSFNKIEPGNYTIAAQKAGYDCDSIITGIASWGESRICNLNLNGLPYICEVILYSEHIDQWWPGEIFRFMADIFIDDPDGLHDIDSLDFIIPDIPFSKHFTPTDDPGHLHLIIEDFELNQINLFDLIGKPCEIKVCDHPGGKTENGPYYFHRIITEAALPLTPSDFQTVTPNPTFTWQLPQLAFGYTLYVDIYLTTPSGSVLVDRISDIPKQHSNFQYTQTLIAGTYFWTVGIKDSLGNRSRSKEASFIVP